MSTATQNLVFKIYNHTVGVALATIGVLVAAKDSPTKRFKPANPYRVLVNERTPESGCNLFTHSASPPHTMRLKIFFLTGFILLFSIPSFAEPPALPKGLAPEKPSLPVGLESPALPGGLSPIKPALPSGLNTPELPGGLAPDKPELPEGTDTPGLPEGLSRPSVSDQPTTDQEEDFVEDEPFIAINGFWDTRGGIRTQSDPHQDRFSLGETRLQFELQKEIGPVTARLVSDFLYDALAPTQNINLETGTGWIDLREANIAFSPFSFADLKIGRQILTWGTGDLIFINDLFPKDWRSFFVGREVEYLKAPSDAIKTSFFSDYANLDVIFTPRFDPDRFINGERVSYFNPGLGEIAGQNAVVRVDRPDSAEWSFRLYQTIGVNELAIYGYNGFWKSPASLNPTTGEATYPDLSTIGASLRRPFLKGIANIEVGYYHSPDSDNGSNPLVRNSEMRFLLGYEQEIVKNLSLGLQYYVEWMQDYDNYENTLPQGIPKRDEDRHLLTTRLTWLTLKQNLIWSLFVFYSPSDQDVYFRPKIHYKITDHWSTELGGNFFTGEKIHTFFGQFKNNNNVYAAFRYSF